MAGRQVGFKATTILTADSRGTITVSSADFPYFFKKAKVWLNALGQPPVEAVIADIDIASGNTMSLRVLAGNVEYTFSNCTAYAGGTIYQNEQLIYDAPDYVTLTNGSSGGGGGGGDASEATLQQTRDAIKASKALGVSLWTDDSNAFYVRREIVDQGTGAISIVYVNPGGSVVTPGVGLRPATGDSVAFAGLTDAQLRATPVPVSASSLPLPGGAATGALQTTGNTSLASIDTKMPALGQANMAGSTPVVIASNQSVLTVQAGSLPLPLGAATEATLAGISSPIVANIDAPLSGLATQATLASLNSKVTAVNTGNVTVSSSVLPTNASTSALQTTGNTSLASIDTKLSNPLAVTGSFLTDAQLRATPVPVSGTFWQATQPISGSVTVSNFPGTQPVSGTVAVSNFPATQPVSGTVSVGNLSTLATLAEQQAQTTELGTIDTSAASIDSKLTSTTATQALQTTGNTSLASIDGSLSSINSKTPALGPTVSAAAVPVTIASDQTVPVSFSVASTLQTADDSAPWLRRIAKLSESLGIVDSAQRQRMTLDSIAAGVTLPTVTTVGTVTTVTTVTTTTTVGTVNTVAAQTSLAGMDREMYINIARQTYAQCIRAKLT